MIRRPQRLVCVQLPGAVALYGRTVVVDGRPRVVHIDDVGVVDFRGAADDVHVADALRLPGLIRLRPWLRQVRQQL